MLNKPIGYFMMSFSTSGTKLYNLLMNRHDKDVTSYKTNK